MVIKVGAKQAEEGHGWMEADNKIGFSCRWILQVVHTKNKAIFLKKTICLICSHIDCWLIGCKHQKLSFFNFESPTGFQRLQPRKMLALGLGARLCHNHLSSLSITFSALNQDFLPVVTSC